MSSPKLGASSLAAISAALVLLLPPIASAQVPPQPTETAILSGALNDGEEIPLPVFANGDTASESQCQWMVSVRKFLVQFSGHVLCYTTGRVVHVLSEGGQKDPATEANYLIVAQRPIPLPTFPPYARRIVAAADGVAIDSDGNIYTGVGATNAPCMQNGSATLLGNLFGGPPPSPVIGLWQSNGCPYVVLQTGDLYYWCSYAVPAPGYPVYAGNVFSAAGISAVERPLGAQANALHTGRPNPFNPMTEIDYSLGTGGRVIIRVFDAAGRRVRTVEDAVLAPGTHAARWDGRVETGEPAASGTYFARIDFPDGSRSEVKLTLVR